MIGLVIVTHGHLADELVKAMEHVVGPQEDVAAICIGPDDDMDHRRQDIFEAIGKVDTGCGVILLTDMFGGTPSNLAISTMDRAATEVIAGVNLPMLVKLAGVRAGCDMNEAIEMAQESGRKYINVASKLLNKEAG